MRENPLTSGLGLPRDPPALSVVIFGASGDLTQRKLVPALFSLFLKGRIGRFRVIGFARRNWTTEAFRTLVRSALDGAQFSRVDTALKDAFAARAEFVRSDFDDPSGYTMLRDGFADPPNRLFYLATPPDACARIVDRLREAGLADQSRGFARIVVEKPFGRDLDSARALNGRIAAAFAESQVFRIDHYLGKETVQNIMLLRFGNAIFEPVWNNRYVDHVEITMAETLGVEGRGGYYESAGALRDMVQNHLLQLACLVAMEPPVDLRPDSVRGEKLKVLRSLVAIGAREVGTETVRGQYTRGTADGADVPGYREEPGVDPASAIETYAALRVHLASWRWAGVPFLLRTGKRLSRRATEISLHFRRPPISLFADGAAPPPDTLVFRIQPREGIMLAFNAKVPGPTTDLRTVAMDFSYGAAFGDELPEAYERLLLDAMVGDATLFMRRDEIEASWEFVTGVLEGWRSTGSPPLETYRAGTRGPAAADLLLGEGDRRWRRL
jgi:glucose-6-phosphate 1-dehydrogenase